MRKCICLFVMIAICLLSCCSAWPSNIDNSDDERAYQIGYDEGYKDGFEYVLSTLRDNANNSQRYMDIADIEESIHIYYRDNPYVDADLVRDDIIYHPDFEHYTLAELLENLIMECIE